MTTQAAVTGAPPGNSRATSVLIVGAALAALALIALPAPAAAQTGSQTEARVHFKKGEADYAAGRYAEALAAYQAGYDAQPLPGFLVNIAQCQRRLGELGRARATYQRFIMVAPDSPLVPEVQKLVADLNQLLAEAEAADRPPAAPIASGSGSGSNETMELDLGDGHAAGHEVGGPGGGGRRPPVSLALPDVPDAQPTHVTVEPRGDATAEPPTHRRWWLWGGAAAVVVAGGATAAILLSRGDSTTTIHDGSLGTVRR